jgi:type VII secretion integral membrane protein EccD
MSSAGGVDLCRVTVVGPARRVDLALPGYVPFADLFPAVARYAGLEGTEATSEPGGWVLQRLGQEPFPPAMTPSEAGLRDGEMIYLRPFRAQLPQLAFDDVADVIATGMNDRPGRWSPRHGRGLALGVGAGILLAGAVVIAMSGPPWTVPSAVAGVVAVVLLVGTLAVARAVGDSRAAAVLGIAAVPYAFLAGLLGLARSDGFAHLGSVQLLPAFAAVTLACVVAAVASGEVALFFGLVTAAVLGVIGAVLDHAFGGLGAAGTAALLATPALALTPLIPGLSFRLARMDLPPVPRNAEDLRRDTLTVDGEEVLRKTTAADEFVSGAVAGIALVAATAAALLAFSGGWLARVTCAVLCCVLLLRSRIFRSLVQRLWLLIPGYAGLAVLAIGAARSLAQGRTVALVVVPLLAGAALVIAVGMWLPGRRPSPFWGRAADIADTLAIVGLFPLALAVAGVFSDIRGLAG